MSWGDLKGGSCGESRSPQPEPLFLRGSGFRGQIRKWGEEGYSTYSLSVQANKAYREGKTLPMLLGYYQRGRRDSNP